MDTVPSVEDTTNTRGIKSKTVFVPIAGVVVGVLIGAGIVAYLFRNAVFFTVPTNTSALSYPDQKVPDLNQKTNILLPKKLVGEDYYLLINKIADELKQVGINNNTTILPLMNTIKQKSAARDFNSFFDLIVQAKGEIKKNNDLLATTREDIAAFKKVNDETISDEEIHNQTTILLTSSDTFVQAFTDYFALLNETLSGSIPTQNLLDKLTEQIISLGSAGSSVQSELNALLILIQQKNKIQTP